MARNIKPLTKSLLIKQSWLDTELPILGRDSQGTNSELIENTYIRKLIHGTFLKLGILTSEVFIQKNSLGHKNIIFSYYCCHNTQATYKNNQSFLSIGKAADEHKFKNQPSNKLLITKVIKLLRQLIEIKSGYDVKIICISAPHKFVDAKLLNDYITLNAQKSNFNFKLIINRLIREYSSLSSANTTPQPLSPFLKGGNPHKIGRR